MDYPLSNQTSRNQSQIIPKFLLDNRIERRQFTFHIVGIWILYRTWLNAKNCFSLCLKKCIHQRLSCKTNLWGCINRLGGVTYQGPAPAIRALVVWLVRDVPTSDRGCHCITGSGWRTEKNNGGLVTLIGRQTEPDKSGPQRSMNNLLSLYRW